MSEPQDSFATYMSELDKIINKYEEKAKDYAKEKTTHKTLTALKKKEYVEKHSMSNARAEMEVFATKEWEERDQKVGVLEVETAALRMRFELGREWINIERTREATARMVV